MKGKNGFDTEDFAERIKPIFDKWCFKDSERKIISQAIPIDNPKRRIDRVILDSDEKIEVETNPKTNKGEDVTTVRI